MSVPAPRGTAVYAQNKRDHAAAACSTELSTTRNSHVVDAAARLLYLTSEQDNGRGPIRVADGKAASYLVVTNDSLGFHTCEMFPPHSF